MEENSLLIRLISIVTLIYIIRLIYTHKLRIGYSWLLLIMGLGFIGLTIWPNVFGIIQYITGSASFSGNIAFFLFAFLFLIVVHCSIMISQIISNLKELAQELSIISSEINEEKMKREAIQAHAIQSSTVFPSISNELHRVAMGNYGDSEFHDPSRKQFSETVPELNIRHSLTQVFDSKSTESRRKHIKAIKNTAQSEPTQNDGLDVSE